MKLQNHPTTQQYAMLIHLALMERGRGLGEELPLQVMRGFFQEMLFITRWQSYHQNILNELVANGWLAEHAASHGTMFYALTPAGRSVADQTIDYAARNCFAFIPQTASLFDRSGE